MTFGTTLVFKFRRAGVFSVEDTAVTLQYQFEVQYPLYTAHLHEKCCITRPTTR